MALLHVSNSSCDAQARTRRRFGFETSKQCVVGALKTVASIVVTLVKSNGIVPFNSDLVVFVKYSNFPCVSTNNLFRHDLFILPILYNQPTCKSLLSNDVANRNALVLSCLSIAAS